MLQTSCYICKSNQHSSFVSIQNDLQNKTFSIVECGCGFYYLNPRPEEEEMKEYYNVTDYHPHSRGEGFIYFLYNFIQRITFKSKYRVLRKYLKEDMKHLDYGGADGKFSKYLNSYSRISSRSFDPYFNDLDSIEFNGKSFNAITLWHVLEHVYDLDVLFKDMGKLLSNSGKLFIAVPNIDAMERKYFNNHWAAYDLPRHLYHFSSKSLEKLLRDKGYRIINKKRMLFDTFYISILSSKKISNIQVIKSIFLSIFISIKVIIKGPNLSSSLFYICEKDN